MKPLVVDDSRTFACFSSTPTIADEGASMKTLSLSGECHPALTVVEALARTSVSSRSAAAGACESAAE